MLLVYYEFITGKLIYDYSPYFPAGFISLLKICEANVQKIKLCSRYVRASRASSVFCLH